MATAIASVAVRMADNTVLFKPNSISFMEGSPEVNVRAEVNGNETSPVFGANFETAIAEFKGTVLNTKENVKLIKELKDTLVFKMEWTDDGFERTMEEATITNKPEFSIGEDGEAEIEVKGSVLTGG